MYSDIPEDCILITLDVEGLYTNINHAKGLRAVRDALSLSNPLNNDVLELLDLSLKSSEFLFKQQWYVKIQIYQWIGSGHLYMATFVK